MASILVLFGQEQYIAGYHRAKALSAIEYPEMNVSENDDDGFGREDLNEILTVPMMSPLRAYIKSVSDLKVLDTPEFNGYLKSPCPTALLIIKAQKVDKRTKFYKALSKAKGVEIKECAKLKTPDELQRVILSEVKARGGQITVDGMKELVRRVNYFNSDEMDLLTVVNYLSMAIAIGNGEVTPEAVAEVVPEVKVQNTWGIASMLREGDLKGLMEQAYITPASEAMGVASALLWDIRIGYKSKLFGLSEIGAKKASAFAGASRKTLLEYLSIIVGEIANVKSGLTADRDLLQEIFNRMLLARQAAA